MCAVCRSVLQCAADCCSVCVATLLKRDLAISEFYGDTQLCSVLQCVAVCYSVLQRLTVCVHCVAARCSAVQTVAVCVLHT